MTDESVTLRRIIEDTVNAHRLMLRDRDEAVSETARNIALVVLQQLHELKIEVVRR